MTITIEAVYQNGVLKPLQPLLLVEHDKVKVVIHTAMTVAEQSAGMLRWSGDPAVLRRVAEDDEFGLLDSP